MARGKKKENELTIEERLEQALVPVEEQPYEVPENWCFFHFTSLIDIEGGTQPPKSQFIDTYKVGYIRLVQIRDFATDKYIVYVPDNKKMRHFNEEDILIARYGASLGRICTGLSGVYNVALAKTIFSKETLYRKYVYWMLQSWAFQKPLLRISRTAQAGFNKNDLAVFKMPLPPLAEQQRIVDRIESLFAKLDEAKEKAQAVVDGFEARKAAILCMAFTGELTSTWREIHKVSVLREVQEKDLKQHLVPQDTQPFSIPKTWRWVFMGGIGYTNIGLTYKPREKSLEGTIVLRSCNIQNGRMDYNDIVRVSTDIPENKQCKKGDILICARNGSKSLVGKCAIIDQDGMSYGAFMAIFRSAYNLYIYYFLNSPFFRNIIDQDVGTTTINQVTQALLKKLPFPFAPVEEQKEIVRILDTLLAKEQQAKETAEAVLDQIEIMKKSILARAFRGELGTNDPTEESAVELLKRVL